MCNLRLAKIFWLWRNGLKSQLTPRFNIGCGGCGARFLAHLVEAPLATQFPTWAFYGQAAVTGTSQDHVPKSFSDNDPLSGLRAILHLPAEPQKAPAAVGNDKQLSKLS